MTWITLSATQDKVHTRSRHNNGSKRTLVLFSHTLHLHEYIRESTHKLRCVTKTIKCYLPKVGLLDENNHHHLPPGVSELL